MIKGIASVTSKNIGIIHVDRHADIQEKDLDERMHTVSFLRYYSFQLTYPVHVSVSFLCKDSIFSCYKYS